MKLRSDGWYEADKGKHFVLTKKGKQDCASYRDKVVGEPVDEYDYEAVRWEVDKGYHIEVDIPDWTIQKGYRVVYEHNGDTLCVGEPIVFPDEKLAKNYMKHYQNYSWMNYDLFIQEATYEGRALKDCREYRGRQVYNRDWILTTDCLEIGDLVEEEIVDYIINLVPPACMRSDCCQCGEPASCRIDENGKTRSTYITFKKINEDVWEYCGECFRGENTQRGVENISVQI